MGTKRPPLSFYALPVNYDNLAALLGARKNAKGKSLSMSELLNQLVAEYFMFESQIEELLEAKAKQENVTVGELREQYPALFSNGELAVRGRRWDN
jgi:hypothetical protein